MTQLETPVAFIVFNRPDTTRRVFEAIRNAKPTHLFIIADGPRVTVPREIELCNEVKKVVSAVDWACHVETNFALENMGCRNRVISGLNWVFSLVEEAIILEDDCLPHASFFAFCQEMLDRFRSDTRIGTINGSNFVAPGKKTEHSYYFSNICHIWGWATWRSAWQKYDEYLENWDTVKRDRLLCELYPKRELAAYWLRVFEEMRSGTGPNTWDYQWIYTHLFNNWLSIVPSVNLISNIGFREDATHTINPGSVLSCRPTLGLDFPLRHPPYVVPMRTFDQLDLEIYFDLTLRRRVTKRLRAVRRLLSRQMGK